MAHKQSPKNRNLRALKITVVVGIALLLPFLGLFYMYDSGQIPQMSDLGPVPAFIYQDHEGNHVSRYDLRGHVTVVAVIPENCGDRCDLIRTRIVQLTDWINAKLIYDHEDEKSPLHLMAMSPQPWDLPPPWRRIQAPIEAGILVPDGFPTDVAGFTVIDQAPSYRLWLPIAGKDILAQLQPLLSRITINHYVHDYLSKRTFFRRVPKEQLVN